MRVRSLGWEELLELEMATDSSILAWKIPWTEQPAGYSPWGRKESDITEHNSVFKQYAIYIVYSIDYISYTYDTYISYILCIVYIISLNSPIGPLGRYKTVIFLRLVL